MAFTTSARHIQFELHSRCALALASGIIEERWLTPTIFLWNSIRCNWRRLTRQHSLWSLPATSISCISIHIFRLNNGRGSACRVGIKCFISFWHSVRQRTSAFVSSVIVWQDNRFDLVSFGTEDASKVIRMHALTTHDHTIFELPPQFAFYASPLLSSLIKNNDKMLVAERHDDTHDATSRDLQFINDG